jgi:rSAM/selenodomain-associated transferase 1
VPLEQVSVAVMTKYPQAGKVKTRLTPVLSPQQAADVHRIFVAHVVNRLNALKPQSLQVVVDPPDKLDAMRELLGSGEYLPQCEGDLGARLSDVHARSKGPMLFFGVDSPDVPVEYVERAAQAMTEADVVIGPSDDGGYWCLGLSLRVEAKRMLRDIPWSSGREREQTIARAKSLGYSVIETDRWDDVDRAEDLKRLCERLGRSQNGECRNLLERLRFLPKEVLS